MLLLSLRPKYSPQFVTLKHSKSLPWEWATTLYTHKTTANRIHLFIGFAFRNFKLCDHLHQTEAESDIRTKLGRSCTFYQSKICLSEVLCGVNCYDEKYAQPANRLALSMDALVSPLILTFAHPSPLQTVHFSIGYFGIMFLGRTV